MDNSSGIHLNDAETAIRVEDDRYVFRRTQEIGNLLDHIADRRAESNHAPTGDFHYAGSIPTVIVEKWMAEGFNIFDPNVSLEDIFKRIRAEDASRLIGTSKHLF